VSVRLALSASFDFDFPLDVGEGIADEVPIDVVVYHPEDFV
jgi:hypothetical protein